LTILVGVFTRPAAGIAAAAGMTLIWPHGPLDVIWSIRTDDTHAKTLALGWTVVAGLWLLGLIALGLAIGSFIRRRWAWWLAVAGIAVNGVAHVGRLAVGGVVEGLVGVAIAALIVFWLTRPGVRLQFVF